MQRDRLPETSRRQLLKTVGGTVVVANFASAIDPVAAASKVTGVVEGLTVDRGTLYVNLKDVGAADHVTLIDPHGQQHGKYELEMGETSAEFTILANRSVSSVVYEEGIYTAHAYRTADGDEKEVGTAEIEFEPNVNVIGLEVDSKTNPLLMLENTGTGPAIVKRIRITEGMPRYTDDPGDENGGAYYAHDTPLGPGERIVLQYDNVGKVPPVEMTSEETADDWCGRTETATFEVDTYSGDRFESSFEVSFGAPYQTHDMFGGDEYSCSHIVGGEGIKYD